MLIYTFRIKTETFPKDTTSLDGKDGRDDGRLIRSWAKGGRIVVRRPRARGCRSPRGIPSTRRVAEKEFSRFRAPSWDPLELPVSPIGDSAVRLGAGTDHSAIESPSTPATCMTNKGGPNIVPTTRKSSTAFPSPSLAEAKKRRERSREKGGDVVSLVASPLSRFWCASPLPPTPARSVSDAAQNGDLGLHGPIASILTRNSGLRAGSGAFAVKYRRPPGYWLRTSSGGEDLRFLHGNYVRLRFLPF
ncbi:hypothetical protein GW17_00013673 [Ensete ventricosum]|nr:hypothetical protein GW17_00013673 [Ensete ventricosum]RZS20834.1 hypothetical protein BHM03_00053389 [Ensete ventricosum]